MFYFLRLLGIGLLSWFLYQYSCHWCLGKLPDYVYKSCILIHCWMDMLNVGISGGFFGDIFWIKPYYLQIKILLFLSFLFITPLLSCLIALAKAASFVLKRSGKLRRHASLFLIFIEMSFSSLSTMGFRGFKYVLFFYIKFCSLHPKSLQSFLRRLDIGFLSKDFSIYTKNIMWFMPFSMFLWCITLFIYVCLAILYLGSIEPSVSLEAYTWL